MATLAKAICKIVHFTHYGSRLPDDLFRAISQSPQTKLRALKLTRTTLDEVTTESFSSAVTKIEKIELALIRESSGPLFYKGYTGYGAIFSAISQCATLKLKSLKLRSYGLNVDPDTLARALCRIVNVDLIKCNLTEEQLSTVFTNISTSSDLKLRRLAIHSLSEVPASDLASAVCRLEAIQLIETFITPIQVEALFTAIAESTELKLKCLTAISFELSNLRPNILASALLRLEMAVLSDNSLTTEQLEAVFTAIAERQEPTLKHLNLSGNPRITEVNADILAAAVIKLEEVDIRTGAKWARPPINENFEVDSVTTNQLNTLLSHISISSDLTLRKLSITYDEQVQQNVDPALLEDVRGKAKLSLSGLKDKVNEIIDDDEYAEGVRTLVRTDISSNRRKVELLSVRTQVLVNSYDELSDEEFI